MFYALTDEQKLCQRAPTGKLPVIVEVLKELQR